MKTLRGMFVWGLWSAFLGLASCSSRYVTPGGPADFRSMDVIGDARGPNGPSSIKADLSRKPAASFPAIVAFLRVQSGGYRSYSSGAAYGSGRFSVVTARELETDEQLAALSALPGLRALAPMNRLILPETINGQSELRNAAASVQADILLMYTIDTTFSSDVTIPALGVISLGLFPNEVQKVSATASAVFLDTRTGYVYGLCESTARGSRLNNAWNTREAIDAARLSTEREAFANLVGELEKTWTQIVATYAPPEPAGPGPRP